VTEADRRTEEVVRERLARDFQDDGVLGEEQGETRGKSGRTWILDPIDGTVSFARGVPLFGSLLALEEAGAVVLGIAALPALGEVVAAARGLGTQWYRGDGAPVRARVSTIARLADALVCTTTLKGLAEAGRAVGYARLLAHARIDRGYCDLYGHVLVATGRADVMVDPGTQVWDNAALLPILEEAGGSFMSLDGERTHRGGSALSTNGRLFEEVRAALGPAFAKPAGPPAKPS
jgi:histidinol phosphatase-like enzyme (inositol monophosphatase family)